MIDDIDQKVMACCVKGGTGRWSVVFLDLAGISEHVLFKQCIGSSTGRRKSLQQLTEEPRTEFMQRKKAPTAAAN